jgi:hypothetical protein
LRGVIEAAVMGGSMGFMNSKSAKHTQLNVHIGGLRSNMQGIGALPCKICKKIPTEVG